MFKTRHFTAFYYRLFQGPDVLKSLSDLYWWHSAGEGFKAQWNNSTHFMGMDFFLQVSYNQQ